MSKKRRADATEDLTAAVSTKSRAGRNAVSDGELSPHSDINVRILRALEEDEEGNSLSTHDFVV
jgi:hypothetical protein